MHVRFIAHAGVAIEEGGKKLLIDPWFTDSSVQNPLLKSLWGHATIDFQIPRTQEKIEAYNPDAILVSHFHTHHAPHDDIMTLVAQSSSMTFGHPDMGEKNPNIAELFSVWNHVNVKSFVDQQQESVGPFTIKGLFHTVSRHIAWHVSTATGSVLHIADPVFNRDNSVRKPDDVWQKFADLKPDFLFINAGGNSLRREKEGVRTVTESAAVSPVEAAQIVAIIKPRAVSLIGCYNHSVWRNRQEYIPPAHQVEEEFYWAVSWLAPETKFVQVKPGRTFAAGDTLLAGVVDTYISR